VTTATREAFELVHEVHGTGDPVLLISGTNDTKSDWGTVVPALEGFQRITFDNRDVGESPRATAPYSVADMAYDAKTLLDRLGIARAHVVGHSMGGTIAQELALLAPERVRSLVLVGTFPRADAYLAELIDTWKRLRRQLPVEDFARAAIFSWCGATTIATAGMKDLLEFVIPAVEAQEIDAFERQLDATMARDRRTLLPSIAAPTLVVWGNEDATVPHSLARELADGIPGAQFRVIEGTGHGPHLEQPEAFNAMVLEFLRSVA
jgi:pimeloyl-ACP methyl ester carboxylesterase